MSFWNWLTGSPAKAAACDLVQLHRQCGGGYVDVMRLSMAALIMATAQGKVSRKNAIILDHVLSNTLRNYVDLCVLWLYVNKASKRQTYEDAYGAFSGQVRHWLLTAGIPHRYLDDDNREQTKAIVDTLREGLGFKGVFPAPERRTPFPRHHQP